MCFLALLVIWAQSAESAPLRNVTVDLQYTEVGYTITHYGVQWVSQTQPFNKEPKTTSKEVKRGILQFGGNEKSAIACLWEVSEGKLYLDLNRNRDFTDDSLGMHQSADRSPSSQHQFFTNVAIFYETPIGRRRARMDLSIYHFRSEPYVTAGLRSFYQEKVELVGQTWQIGAIHSLLDDPATPAPRHLLIRPWTARDESFDANGGALAAFEFKPKLFLRGQGYGLQVAFAKAEKEPTLRFVLAEEPPKLGELNIVGKYIHRMVLQGNSYAVVLDSPTSSVKVPAEIYSDCDVYLKQEQKSASRDQQKSPPLVVSQQTPVTIHEGGPLTNTVAITRRGKSLRLDYRLQGEGGATYSLQQRDHENPPRFAVYQGQKQIATGKFEFG